jgi:predicted nucleic acid-binding protein
MLAIDTNVFVRFLTGDHPEQSASARRMIESRDVFIGSTVLLDTEWILRSVYRYDAARVVAALGALAGLPTVTIEDSGLAAQALEAASTSGKPRQTYTLITVLISVSAQAVACTPGRK